MEPLLISLGVIAVAVSLLIALLKSNRCDSLQTEVDILRRRNDTLEEMFKQQEAKKSPLDESEQSIDALETITRFATENGCKLEQLEALGSGWIAHSMLYQGGHFFVYTRSCEMVLHFNNFEELEYTSDTLTLLLMLCFRFNSRYRYFKLDYEYQQDTNLFSLSIYIELINPPYEIIGPVFASTWNAVNIVREEIDRIRKECGLENDPQSASDPQSKPTDGSTDSLFTIPKSNIGEA